MASLSEPTNTVWLFPFMPQDWEQTPLAVQAYVRTLRDEVAQLHDRVETLEARLAQNSTTSSRPPSSDAPFKKPRRHTTSTTPRKAGGKPGHPGQRQVLLPPTTVKELRPERCTCGSTTFTLTTPYHTHQVLELPPIAMEVTHWVLHQGWCQACRRWSRAHIPAEHTSGYGPRFSALMGELAGTYGNGRRIVQAFCASVLGVPISLGGIQKVLARVTQAIDPYYTVIAQQARQAPVNYIDETPWYCLNTLEWLWVMASERVALYMVHPRRSKEAFAALIDDWAGILVSDGYGVYQNWVACRQTCLAHLIRTARSLAERQQAELAACGTWALAELQRLCHMATAPPTGGSGGPGMPGSASGLTSITIAQMRWAGLPAACCARWTRSGCFSPSTGLIRRITEQRERCALGCCGASAPWERPVTKAIAGSSGSCRSKKPAVSMPELPMLCWWTPSAVSSMANNPISPGSTRG